MLATILKPHRTALLEPVPQSEQPIAGRLIDGGHTLDIRVYFEDTDFSGIVYHATYLRWCERGRSDYLRLLGIHHTALWEGQVADIAPSAFVIRAMEIDFLQPARIDDIVTVTTAPVAATKATLTMAQEVRRDDQTLFKASVRAALLGRGGRLQRIPDQFTQAVRGSQSRPSAAPQQ